MASSLKRVAGVALAALVLIAVFQQSEESVASEPSANWFSRSLLALAPRRDTKEPVHRHGRVDWRYQEEECTVSPGPPTAPPTTSAPTAPPSTTRAPTVPPTSVSPTTAAPTGPPTTAAPTGPPTTASPTGPPTTAAPTRPPTTASPTGPPTTAAPTAVPTTAAPTEAPTTTAAPTTAAPTEAPTTAAPTFAPCTLECPVLPDMCLENLCVIVDRVEVCLPFPKNCTTDDPCLVASCNPDVGCEYVRVTGTCECDNPCVTVDACFPVPCVDTPTGPECLAPVPVVCNDGDNCTDNYCVDSMDNATIAFIESEAQTTLVFNEDNYTCVFVYNDTRCPVIPVGGLTPGQIAGIVVGAVAAAAIAALLAAWARRRATVAAGTMGASVAGGAVASPLYQDPVNAGVMPTV